MKVRLLSLCILLFSIALTALKPVGKKDQITLYRFTYDATEGYSEAEVENEDENHWGTGLVVTSPIGFLHDCDGTNDKACCIVVPKSSTEIKSGTQSTRILKQSSIALVAFEGEDDNMFYISSSSSTGVTSARNRD